MTGAESSDATSGKEPLLQTAEAAWTHYPKSNAFNGYGAINVDLERDNKCPTYKTVEEAKADAISKGYVGFTRAPKTGQIWRLKTVTDPSSFKYAGWAEVYVLDRSRLPVADVNSGFWCRCLRRRPMSRDDTDASARKKPRNHTWTHLSGRNAFDGYGAVNVDLAKDNSTAIFKSVDNAKADAISNGYAGFTYEPATGRMWRLKKITDPDNFKYAKWADVYFLNQRGGDAG